jgi:hypothetical protein
MNQVQMNLKWQMSKNIVTPVKTGVQYFHNHLTWTPAGVYPVLDTGPE